MYISQRENLQNPSTVGPPAPASAQQGHVPPNVAVAKTSFFTPERKVDRNGDSNANQNGSQSWFVSNPNQNSYSNQYGNFMEPTAVGENIENLCSH